MNNVSPLTGKPGVEIVEEIDLELIKRLYSPLDLSHYFVGLSKVELRKCVETGYLFYWPLNLEGKEDVYRFLQRRKAYYKGNRFEFNKALEYIRDGDCILEIGAGEGHFLEMLNENRKVNAAGLEINSEAIEMARSKGIKMFRETIEEHEPEAVYDVIVCFQLLEHIGQVGSFIKQLVSHLRPSGKLLVSVPNNGGFMYHTKDINLYNLPPHHMGLWTESALRKAALHFDLNLIKICYEALQRENYPLFDAHVRRRLDKRHFLFSYVWKKLPNNFKNSIFKLASGWIRGHTAMVVYEKRPS